MEQRLGHAHACIGVTLDIHSHVTPGMREEAAERIYAGPQPALAA
jgi:hypothetical protein